MTGLKTQNKAAVPARAAARRRRCLRRNLRGYALLLPALAVLIGIGFVPIAQTLVYSFQYNIQTDIENRAWVGLANYITLLNPGTFEGARFYNELRNTLIFTVCSVALELAAGFAGAFLMNRKGPLRWLTRTAVLIPWAIPGIVVAQMFAFLFNDQLGAVNRVLQVLGLSGGTTVWLAAKPTAMLAVVLADVWKQFPYVAILLLAGLQTIDREQYEAAQVDGAGVFSRFWHITLPNIRPVLLVVLLFRTMGGVRIFDIIYGMTGGGPADGTDVLMLGAYNSLFGDLNYGLGSAKSVMVCVVILAISAVYIRLLGKKRGRGAAA